MTDSTVAAEGQLSGRAIHEAGAGGAWTRDAGLWAVIGLAAYLVVYLVWRVVLWGMTPAAGTLNDLAFLPAYLVAAGLAWRAARNPGIDRRSRHAWSILAVASLASWAGDVLWAWYDVVLAITPFPSWADAGYLLAYPLLLWGLLSFPVRPRSRGEQVTFWLDAATVMLGSWMISWYFVLGPTAVGSDAGLLTTLLSIAYPAGDLVLLFGIISVLLREPEDAIDRALRILVAGLALTVVADVAFGYFSVHGASTERAWLDQLWMLAPFLMALAAAYHGARAAGRLPVRPGRVRRSDIFAALPYSAIAGGYVLLLTVGLRSHGYQLAGLLLGAFALTVLVTARQFAALRENRLLLASSLALSAELRESEARYRSLVQHASDIILVIAPDGTLRYVSPSVRRITGHPPEHVLSTRLVDWIHPADTAAAHAFLGSMLGRHGVANMVELRFRHAEGSWCHLEVLGSSLSDEAHDGGIVVNARDTSDRKRLEEQLTWQAYHDALTGLPNRSLFLDRLERALDGATRREQLVALLFIDIDRFKVINDSLGHAPGDRVLITIARRLESSLRGDSLAARLGGDEFTVLLPGIRDVDDAIQAAGRIQQHLHEPIGLDGRQMFVTASIGIAVSAPGETHADELLRNADIAMYQAKLRGRARCEVFDAERSAGALERLDLEHSLRRAIERDELLIHYQPVIQLASGRIVEVEALARWEHPTRGMIPPAVFIPLAEEAGLIGMVGDWVLRRACRDALAWRSAGAPLVLSVNLSARQFQNVDLARDIARVLDETGFDPHRLKLEITESVAMDSDAATLNTLSHLKALGIRLVIDDFGTGYSALGYLHTLPVDALKIDRSFTRQITQTAGDLAVLRATIAVARALALDVTAEGIESEAQHAALRDLGCDYGQGYLFASPQAPDEISRLLQAGQTLRIA